jgi:hypothetical protein
MVCRKTSRRLLRLSVNGLLMTNEQGQHFWTLQRSRSQPLDTANDDVTGQLDNSAAKRTASVKRCRGPEDAVGADHGSLNHFPRLEHHDQRHHSTRRKVDVLNFLFCFKQDRVLLERSDLEIGLKSVEVVLAELVEQKVSS